MIVGLAMGLFLFNYLPNLIAEMFKHLGVENSTLKNVVAEVVKIIFFIVYLWLISKLPEIRELFKYHGAEHKAINTLEAKQELTISSCLAQTRLHPRCGTSFAIIVLIIGFIIFTFVPRYPITGRAGNWLVDVPVRVGMEILILPIVAGISYELLRFAGKMRNEKWVMTLFKPGLWMQHITTVEPNEGQTEVALTALKAVVHAEKTGELINDPKALPISA